MAQKLHVKERDIMSIWTQLQINILYIHPKNLCMANHCYHFHDIVWVCVLFVSFPPSSSSSLFIFKRLLSYLQNFAKDPHIISLIKRNYIFGFYTLTLVFFWEIVYSIVYTLYTKIFRKSYTIWNNFNDLKEICSLICLSKMESFQM